MLLSILPHELRNLFTKKLKLSSINEIRLRAGQPVICNVSGKLYYLNKNGLSNDYRNSISVKYEDIENFIYSASDASIYAVNHQIKEGFLTLKGGYRIGVCGEVVYNENNEILTIKNIYSVNIRIPHFINGCSKTALEYIIDNKINNTLILSPPGAGKTTFLRDFIFQLSERKYALNVLVIDERYEIANIKDGIPQFDLGYCADIMSGISKNDGFERGIRTMGCDVIFVDEIGDDKDFTAMEYSLTCGVSIVATAHCESLEELKRKPGFFKLLQNKIFNRFIILSNRKGQGTIEGIYDGNYKLLYREV